MDVDSSAMESSSTAKWPLVQARRDTFVFGETIGTSTATNERTMSDSGGPLSLQSDAGSTFWSGWSISRLVVNVFVLSIMIGPLILNSVLFGDDDPVWVTGNPIILVSNASRLFRKILF